MRYPGWDAINLDYIFKSKSETLVFSYHNKKGDHKFDRLFLSYCFINWKFLFHPYL